MNHPTLRRAIALSSLMIVTLACWIVAGLVADQMGERELDDAIVTQRQISSAAADNMAQMIASDLAMARAIPETIAEMRMIQRALSQAQNYAAKRPAMEPELRETLLKDPQLAGISDFLHNAQGFSGLDNIWLVNTRGLCVASSNAATPNSFVGRDMAARAYLAEALLGGFTQAYGVGRSSGEPGIFIASPVYDDGELVGAIVAKLGIARLRHWVARAGTFIADENGVIIMAHDSAVAGRALPHARVETMSADERENIYLRTDFPEFGVQPLASQVAHDAPWVPSALGKQIFELPGTHTPSLYEMRGGLNSGLSAHLVDPLISWPELLRNHRNLHLLVFVLLAGSIMLAYLIGASYLREKRHHRATRHLAEQLQEANLLLSAEARDDALTGALSRRYFLDLLQKEIAAARAGGKPLCLAIADLDHFKQINDRFGHAIGDRALEHFVTICRLELRTSDAIGRLGGEEFGIVLPATTLTDGLAVAQRLHERLRAQPSARLPAGAELSVSIGITELSGTDLPERIMSRADLALYAAKSAGRDRTKALPPDGPAPAGRAAFATS
ncbi:diguanylate cyclase [Trinickia violacea]|uniref:diguanylate cyclase n=1 Tax=Trinickia violacea TaxID=2571746 RepID=A0A4P8IL79_9BURK|nr:sensor domain-containing diguanylate cyclase [Trinickia violacea]QCP48631.1 diguanylate cyclase [Trinickia violacea]